MTRFKNLSSLLLHISTWLSTMNGYNITDSTVPDYAECLWHLNRVLWFAWLVNELSGWSSPTQSLRVWGSNPLVTLRFFLCAIVVPNVQYLSRNSSVLMHVHAIFRKLISRLIIIQKPLKSWVLQLIAVSIPLSQSIGLRCMSSNGVLFWTLNERLNYDLVAFQIRITYQYSEKNFYSPHGADQLSLVKALSRTKSCNKQPLSQCIKCQSCQKVDGYFIWHITKI